ncbi:MAG TPA: neutral/alkaline non-lysosomal ceramidase N-terminal domain-containing protein [Myxococcota bacterium]|nr:neutral/alkaline non-lysosomal ceramidase N-terminal domain-containing protein [Myxococcota bacterium]
MTSDGGSAWSGSGDVASRQEASTLQAGWGRCEFTPVEPVPLAGYTHLRDRMSARVRDPLFARAVVLRQAGGPDVALVVYDLVITTEELYQGLRKELADTGLDVVCSATHTHSASGGFWRPLLGRAFLGRFRPGALERLIEAGAMAVRDALHNIGPVRVSSGTVLIPGLNGNRRDHHGILDEELHVLRLSRDDADAILFSYPGHPVIVAERDHLAVSGDFPGEAAVRIERQFDFAMYLAGALGGVDVRFPHEPVTVEENLEMMAGPIANGAVMLARSNSAETAVDSSMPILSRAMVELRFEKPDSCWSYDDDHRRMDWFLNRIATRLIKPVPRVARVEGIRIGPMAIIGLPADIGIGLSMQIKQAGKERGLARVVTMSQTGGCIGYVHMPQDYAVTPADEGDAITMGRYENAMNFFGHDTGTKVLQAAVTVLDRLVGGR